MEVSRDAKEIVLPTPRQGVYLLLSEEQLGCLYHMMEAADSERKALSLLHLFEA